MPDEKPTVENEPVVDNTIDDATALMDELKKLDIQSPADIQNMATASHESGKAWNEVGNLRKEVDRLTRALETKPQQNEYGENDTVDLGKVVEEKVQGVLNNYLQGQQQAQQMAMKAMAEVKSDPEYGIVGGVFEKYINSPDAIMKLQTGQTDYKTEFLKTKAAYYRNLAQRSSKTLEGFMDKTSKTPPHMEAGNTQATPMVEQSTEKAEQFNKIKQAQREGNLDSNQALDKIVKSMMPDANVDPSFFTP